MPSSNIIGPSVRRLRSQMEWTQAELAAKCGVRGWDVSRGTLSKIEAQVRCVSEAELWILAEVLGCSLEALYPNRRKDIMVALSRA